MASAPKSPFPRVLLVAASILFWALVVVGAIKENDIMIRTALGLGVVILLFVVAVAARRSKTSRLERERLLDKGTLAKALIVSATNNGSLNNNPYVDFVLEIRREGEEPYRVEHRTLVSQMAIPRVQPGTEIDVYVDASDREAVAIDPSVTS